jgi:hypothetical protein
MIAVGCEDKRRKLNNAGGRELARLRTAPPAANSESATQGIPDMRPAAPRQV